MEEELAKTLANLHSLTLAVVGEGICDNRDIIFVYDIVLAVACSKDNRAMHGNTGPDKRRSSDILGIDQHRIDLMESLICCSLSYSIVVFGLRCIRSIICCKVTCNFTFGLRVNCRNEFRHGGLLLLAFSLESCPSFFVCNLDCR
jgi:hypothetical protein